MIRKLTLALALAGSLAAIPASAQVVVSGADSATGQRTNVGDAANKAFRMNCVVGCPASTTDTDDGTIAGAQIPPLTINLSYLWNGANWVRVIGDSTNGLKVNCTLGCSASSITDADDASIATGQTVALNGSEMMVYDATVWRRFTIGTAGSASAQVLTVQGIASMTPLLATLSGTNTVQGGLTTNNAAPAASNVGALTAVASAAAQSYTEGRQVLQRVDLFGAQPAFLTDSTTGAALTPSIDATHDSAAKATGPQVMGECDDTATDAVDEGDAGRLRINCATRELMVQPNTSGATAATIPTRADYIGGIGGGATGGWLIPVVVCDSQAFLDMTTATTTELVALTASQTIHICHIRVISNGTTTFTFKRGTGSNCGTGTASIDNAIELTAQTGYVAGTGVGEVLSGNTAANAVCVTNSAAVNLHIFVRYAKY